MGGDKTFAHLSVRNDIYRHAKAGSTGPVLEAAGVLRTLGVEEEGVATANRERPADILLCRSQDIKVGRCRGGFMGRVALDVGIICSQAASHLGAAAAEVCGAAENYARTKCSRADMERRCGEVGVLFQPLIFESLGGVSMEAERVIKSLNQAVAAATDSPYGEVATRFWQRVSIDIQRCQHKAFVRRVVRAGGSEALGSRAAFGSLAGLEIPGGL